MRAGLRGATASEYGLISGLIGIAIIGSLVALSSMDDGLQWIFWSLAFRFDKVATMEALRPMLDADNNGEISNPEASSFLIDDCETCPTQAEMNTAFTTADLNANGGLSTTEWTNFSTDWVTNYDPDVFEGAPH